MANRRTYTPEEIAAQNRLVEEDADELDHDLSVDDLVGPEELENAAPFYFVLRAYIQQLKEARKEGELTLEDIAAKSGIAVASLSRLETGVQTNPTWKTLGLYAVAVGCRPQLNAERLKVTQTAATTVSATTEIPVSTWAYARSKSAFVATARGASQHVGGR